MFWLCAVWACTIFSVYEISLDIVHYLDNPVNTIFKVTYVNELTFPAITICNNNQITKSWAMSSPFMRVIQNYYSHPGQASLPMNLSSYNWTGFSFDKLMFEAGHKVKDTVFLCKWKGVSCSVADFTPESTFLGGCFTFNANQSLRVSGTGTDNALHLVLNVQQDEYVGNSSSGAGFRLLFREAHEPPNTDRFDMALQPGTQTLISLTVKNLSSLPAPYGDCKEGNDLKMFNKYSVTACAYECRTRIAGERCGCREMHPSGIDTTIPVCLPQVYRDCLKPTIIDINTKGMCSSCHVPCKKSTYIPRLSYSQYPSNHIADNMAKAMNETRQFIRDNFLEVDIYLEDMIVETVEQQPAYSLSNLVGVIGGTLGVFIGASILTITEFLQFFISLIPFQRQ
ncbi:hypothetical protein QZH41_004518 [Actinostola sp. cb2023]|nr:hypothetical protein QZH41_004518 [Actinostola sp. cb2023]